ncbi:MAG TPA: hypothetical protein VFX69_06415 [Steroidobacteraceae bacterium]|nr:hypothetical protein [Steroidobacteraceae bacterium]
MAVMLDKALKREVAIGDEPYMLTIAPDGLKLVPKGKRNGVELRWEDLVSGQAALAVALNASLERLTDRSRRATTDPVQAPVAAATARSDSRRRSSKPDAPRGRTKRRRA